jgi:hypothetical protein
MVHHLEHLIAGVLSYKAINFLLDILELKTFIEELNDILHRRAAQQWVMDEWVQEVDDGFLILSESLEYVDKQFPEQSLLQQVPHPEPEVLRQSEVNEFRHTKLFAFVEQAFEIDMDDPPSSRLE